MDELRRLSPVPTIARAVRAWSEHLGSTAECWRRGFAVYVGSRTNAIRLGLPRRGTRNSKRPSIETYAPYECEGCIMSEKPVVIFGMGAFAQVAAVYLLKDSPREVVAYTVDGKYATTDTFADLPVVAFEELLESHPPDRVDLLVATGFRGVN